MRPPHEPFPFRNLVSGVALHAGVASGADAGMRRPTRQQRAPCHPEVREREQRHHMRPVLRQPAYPAFAWSTASLWPETGARSSRGPRPWPVPPPPRPTPAPASPLARRGLATIRVAPGVSHQRAMPRYPEPAWTTASSPCSRDPSTARSGTLAGTPRPVDGAGVRVDPSVHLHAEEPLVPLPG